MTDIKHAVLHSRSNYLMNIYLPVDYRIVTVWSPWRNKNSNHYQCRHLSFCSFPGESSLVETLHIHWEQLPLDSWVSNKFRMCSFRVWWVCAAEECVWQSGMPRACFIKDTNNAFLHRVGRLWHRQLLVKRRKCNPAYESPVSILRPNNPTLVNVLVTTDVDACTLVLV